MARRSSWCVLVLFMISLTAYGATIEPTPYDDPNVRDLRPDYIKTWHVFTDTLNDGILNPGDSYVDSFENWWTPQSASTQYNIIDRGAGSQSGIPFSQPQFPMTPPDEPYWLDREEKSVSFYMTHSHWDNSDFSTKTLANPKTNDFRWMDPADAAMLQERNMYRNGYAMGWLTNSSDYDGNGGGTVAGSMKMDILVHDGKSADSGETTADYGAGFSNIARSNPQLSVSDDISNLAVDPGNHLAPPIFTDINGNDLGYQYTGLNDKRWDNQAEFDAIVDSMEVLEYLPSTLTPADMVNSGDSPNEILANLTDGNGNAYAYQDAFLIRDPSGTANGADYDEGETDGGVIAGLSGYDFYEDPQAADEDWGEQQVIRIDIDPSSLIGMEKIKIFDFGFDGGASQIDPTVIVLDVDPITGLIKINGQAIPDNRIYIATVHVPEPVSMAFVGIGGLAMILTKKRK